MKEFWNDRYGQTLFAYGELPNEYLRDKLLQIPAGKVLFACEGEGRNAVFAAKQNWETYAFDQSKNAKIKANLLANKANVCINYTVADIENIDYEKESFDVLVLIFAHFPENIRQNYHRKLASLLKKDGILILEGFAKEQIEFQKENPKAGGPKDKSMLFDLPSLQNDFSNFHFQEAKQLTIKLSEGLYHQGKAEVVRIFAKKTSNQ